MDGTPRICYMTLKLSNVDEQAFGPFLSEETAYSTAHLIIENFNNGYHPIGETDITIFIAEWNGDEVDIRPFT